MNKRVIILALSVLCLVGCARPSSEAALQFIDTSSGVTERPFDSIAQMEYLATADPQMDAVAAFRKKDYAFLALSGMVSDVPGFGNRADVRKILIQKTIAGTGGANDEFERAAKNYALRYNLKMLELLQSR